MDGFTCECPKCIGAKTIMVPKPTRGFHYEVCSLCTGTGVVETEIANDYVFAEGGEENFDI